MSLSPVWDSVGGRPVPGTQLETVEKFDLAPGKCDVPYVGLELTWQVSDTSRDCW
jgi:hypothetical protein